MTERSKPYFFAFESEKTHGRKGVMLAHCIRIETIEVGLEGGQNDDVKFTLLGADYDTDPRVKKLIEAAKRFQPGGGS